MALKILVVGATGQVARALMRLAVSTPHAITCLGRPGLDITQPDKVETSIAACGANLIINAAAYTAVDQAESEPDLAFAANAAGPGFLAEATARREIPLLHLSTDYVFSGGKAEAYTETDPTDPQNAYGRSKRAGEQAIQAANPRHYIFRTAWIYSPFGQNFVKTMLRLAKTREQVSVVSDQIGNPTSALDIAKALLSICDRIESRQALPSPGIYNLASPSSASWDEVARTVFSASAKLGGPTAEVTAIASKDFPTPVKRPSNSRLNCAKVENVFGIKLPVWQESLVPCVTELISTTVN